MVHGAEFCTADSVTTIHAFELLKILYTFWMDFKITCYLELYSKLM